MLDWQTIGSLIAYVPIVLGIAFVGLMLVYGVLCVIVILETAWRRIRKGRWV